MAGVAFLAEVANLAKIANLAEVELWGAGILLEKPEELERLNLAGIREYDEGMPSALNRKDMP